MRYNPFGGWADGAELQILPSFFFSRVERVQHIVSFSSDDARKRRGRDQLNPSLEMEFFFCLFKGPNISTQDFEWESHLDLQSTALDVIVFSMYVRKQLQLLSTIVCFDRYKIVLAVVDYEWYQLTLQLRADSLIWRQQKTVVRWKGTTHTHLRAQLFYLQSNGWI